MSTTKNKIEQITLQILSKTGLNPEALINGYFKLRFFNRNSSLPKNKKIILDFSKFFYDQGRLGKTWGNTYWFGHKILKNPLDLWIYQEMIFNLKPDLIIETGTSYGGSALYYANILDILGKGSVVTCELNPPISKSKLPKHRRIHYLFGNSVEEKIVEKICKHVNKSKKVMVVLDSDHEYSHVLKELEIYSKVVSINSYLIVEDTNVNGHPVYNSHGPGPYEAVVDFLKNNKNFVVDKSYEKYYVTHNPNGYLMKIKS